MKHYSSSTTLIVVNIVGHTIGLMSTLKKLGQNYVWTLIYQLMVFDSKGPHCRLVTKIYCIKIGVHLKDFQPKWRRN